MSPAPKLPSAKASCGGGVVPLSRGEGWAGGQRVCGSVGRRRRRLHRGRRAAAAAEARLVRRHTAHPGLDVEEEEGERKGADDEARRRAAPRRGWRPSRRGAASASSSSVCQRREERPAAGGLGGGAVRPRVAPLLVVALPVPVGAGLGRLLSAASRHTCAVPPPSVLPTRRASLRKRILPRAFVPTYLPQMGILPSLPWMARQGRGLARDWHTHRLTRKSLYTLSR